MSITHSRTTARTLFGFLAAIGLLFSLFAIATPALADGNDSPQVCTDLAVNVSAEGPGQSEDEVTYTAEAGKVITGVCIKSGKDAVDGEMHSGLITADGWYADDCYEVDGIGTATVTVTRADDSDCKGISHVDVQTGTASQSPAGSPAGSPASSPDDDNASLNIHKLIEGTRTRLPGAVFEIEGMEGTFVTDENGEICITGLPEDSEWLVREIQAPPGYEIVEPAEQLVEVDDDGDCDSPDARFYNRPVSESSPSVEASVEASVEQSTQASASPTGEVEGGNPTPTGGAVPNTALGSSSVPAWPFAVLALMSLGGLLYLRLSSEATRSR